MSSKILPVNASEFVPPESKGCSSPHLPKRCPAQPRSEWRKQRHAFHQDLRRQTDRSNLTKPELPTPELSTDDRRLLYAINIIFNVFSLSHASSFSSYFDGRYKYFSVGPLSIRLEHSIPSTDSDRKFAALHAEIDSLKKQLPVMPPLVSPPAPDVSVPATPASMPVQQKSSTGPLRHRSPSAPAPSARLDKPFPRNSPPVVGSIHDHPADSTKLLHIPRSVTKRLPPKFSPSKQMVCPGQSELQFAPWESFSKTRFVHGLSYTVVCSGTGSYLTFADRPVWFATGQHPENAGALWIGHHQCGYSTFRSSQLNVGNISCAENVDLISPPVCLEPVPKVECLSCACQHFTPYGKCSSCSKTPLQAQQARMREVSTIKPAHEDKPDFSGLDIGVVIAALKVKFNIPAIGQSSQFPYDSWEHESQSRQAAIIVQQFIEPHQAWGDTIGKPFELDINMQCVMAYNMAFHSQDLCSSEEEVEEVV